MGDNVPWGAFTWSVTLTDARGSVDLTMGQALQVFAAVELDRVWSLDDIRKALGARSFWSALMDGANGLHPDSAPKLMTDTAIFDRLKCTSVTWHPWQTPAQREERARAAIARLSGKEAV